MQQTSLGTRSVYPPERLETLRQEYYNSEYGPNGSQGPWGETSKSSRLDFMLMRREFMVNGVVSEREANWLMGEFSISRVEAMPDTERRDFLQSATGMVLSAAQFARVPKVRTKLLQYAQALENMRSSEFGYPPRNATALEV